MKKEVGTEMQRKEKIKTGAVLGLILVLLLLGMGAAGYRVWKEYRNILMDNQYEQLQTATRILSGSIKTSMKEYEWDFRTLEHIWQEQSGSEKDLGTNDIWKSLYQPFMENMDTFVCDLFWTRDGKFIDSFSGNQLKNPVFIGNTAHGILYQQMEDAEGNRYIVLRNNDTEGLRLCMAVDEEDYYRELISNIRVGENGYVVIKNSDGKIIMHPDGEQWGIDVIEGRKEMYPELDYSSLEQMIREQKSGKEGISLYYSYWWTDPELPKVYKVSAYAPVDMDGDFWVVSTVTDYEEFYAPIREGFVKITALSAGGMAVVFAMFLFMGKLLFDRQKSRKEINYLKELNGVLEEVHRSEETIAHQQRLQIMGTMTGGIAHEFNNFLTPVMGHAELLMMELPEGSEEYESACEIYEASEKAKEIVRQLSALSRKNVETVYRRLQVKRLVARVLKMVSSVCPDNISLESAINLGEEEILGNATQINQVILNICVNAIHAIGRQDGKLMVTADVQERDTLEEELAERLRDTWKKYIRIDIGDNGCGMDRETLRQIFDPFFTTKKAGEGTGLGLALAEQIMIAHKGCVTAESEPGKGSTFHLYFPVLEAGEEDSGKPDDEVQYRIVIVDDSEKVLEMLRGSFKKLDIEIVTLRSLGELREWLKTHEAEAVFADEMLPDGSSTEFFMSIAGSYSGMARIVMTDIVTRELAEARQRGIISGYVEKPVSDMTLLSALRHVLQEQ